MLVKRRAFDQEALSPRRRSILINAMRSQHRTTPDTRAAQALTGKRCLLDARLSLSGEAAGGALRFDALSMVCSIARQAGARLLGSGRIRMHFDVCGAARCLRIGVAQLNRVSTWPPRCASPKSGTERNRHVTAP